MQWVTGSSTQELSGTAEMVRFTRHGGVVYYRYFESESLFLFEWAGPPGFNLSAPLKKPHTLA